MAATKTDALQIVTRIVEAVCKDKDNTALFISISRDLLQLISGQRNIAAGGGDTVKQTMSEFLSLSDGEKFMLIQKTNTRNIPKLDLSLDSARQEIEIRVKFLETEYTAFLVSLDKDPLNATLRLCIGDANDPEHPVTVIKDSGSDLIKHWEEVKSVFTPLIYAEARDNSGILEMYWKHPGQPSYFLQFNVQKNAEESEKTWEQIFGNPVLSIKRGDADIKQKLSMLSTREIKRACVFLHNLNREVRPLQLIFSFPPNPIDASFVSLATDPQDATLRLCVRGGVEHTIENIQLHKKDSGLVTPIPWRNVCGTFFRTEQVIASIKNFVLILFFVYPSTLDKISFDVVKNSKEQREWVEILQNKIP